MAERMCFTKPDGNSLALYRVSLPIFVFVGASFLWLLVYSGHQTFVDEYLTCGKNFINIIKDLE